MPVHKSKYNYLFNLDICSHISTNYNSWNDLLCSVFADPYPPHAWHHWSIKIKVLSTLRLWRPCSLVNQRLFSCNTVSLI